MIRNVIYLAVVAFLLVACSSHDDEVAAARTGYVMLGDIVAGDVEAVTVPTRAVDADLNVEIQNGVGDVLAQFAAGDAAAGQKIELEPGAYTLHAYTGNVGATYGNDELGEAKYIGTVPFNIQAEKTTYVSFAVPMVNAAVSLKLPDAFVAWFTAYTFTATLGERTVSLADGETAYFDLPATQDVKTVAYILDATNSDGEAMTSSGSFDVQPGTSYTVTYNLATRSFCVVAR